MLCWKKIGKNDIKEMQWHSLNLVFIGTRAYLGRIKNTQQKMTK